MFSSNWTTLYSFSQLTSYSFLTLEAVTLLGNNFWAWQLKDWATSIKYRFTSFNSWQSSNFQKNHNTMVNEILVLSGNLATFKPLISTLYCIVLEINFLMSIWQKIHSQTDWKLCFLGQQLVCSLVTQHRHQNLKWAWQIFESSHTHQHFQSLDFQWNHF